MEFYKILICDDNPPNTKILVKLLEETGAPYKMYQALSGEMACKVALKVKPDLIIMDWEMPGMSGIDVIRQLKADPVTQWIPIIMATGAMTSSENLNTALEAGAVDYIRKPIDKIELTARVHSALILGEAIKESHQKSNELARLNRELKSKDQELYFAVITDPLTGLYTRSFLLDQISREFAKSVRHQLPLSCILLDFDQFKQNNKAYGHFTGDLLLRESAQRIRNHLRKEDVIGRYGGEEFLVVLPNVPLDPALDVAAKIQKEIQSKPFVIGQVSIQLTITMGVSSKSNNNCNKVEDLVTQAGMALLEGQKRGKGQIIPYNKAGPED